MKDNVITHLYYDLKEYLEAQLHRTVDLGIEKI